MLISLPTAKAHLVVETDEQDALITLYVGAASDAATEYLNRKLYVNQTALDAAVAAVPAVLTAASVAYAAARDAAASITNEVEQASAMYAADHAYTAARTTARETRVGMVVNDMIRAAILLTLGDLYSVRADTIVGTISSSLPAGARSLLQPYRVGLGI